MKTGLLKAAKCLFTNDVIIWPLHWRSLQCPPNSCRNPVIPGESGGFRRNELWQEGLLFSSFQFLIIPELRLECSAECTGIRLFGVCTMFGIRCLFVAHPLPNKYNHLSFPPLPPSSPLPPPFVIAHHGLGRR